MQLFEGDMVDQVLDPLAAGGADWVRTRVLWSQAEPANTSPPTYNWGYVDQVLIPPLRKGLTPIVSVYNNPSWASTTDCGPVNRVPVDRFGQFMGELAERFDADGDRDAPGRPLVRHWQVSNEPDFSLARAGGEDDSGGCFGGQALDYGLHLRSAYIAVKAAQPSAVVIFGGVAYDRFYNKSGYTPTGPHDYQFTFNTLDALRIAFGTGAGWPYFDWMALHNYNDFRNSWDGPQPNNQELIGKIQHFRVNQLVRPGLWDARSRPLALTEASLPSMPSDAFTNRSEALQATYPAQLLARGFSTGVSALIWYSASDSSRGSCANIYDWLTFGLLRSEAMETQAGQCSPNPIPAYRVNVDHETKPSHAAFAAAARQLSGASFDRQLDTSQTGNALIEAYRVRRADTRYAIVAWADNGERIGRVGFPPATAVMRFSAAILPGWTGDLAVTDHLGNVRHYAGVGTGLNLVLTHEPIFVSPE